MELVDVSQFEALSFQAQRGLLSGTVPLQLGPGVVSNLVEIDFLTRDETSQLRKIFGRHSEDSIGRVAESVCVQQCLRKLGVLNPNQSKADTSVWPPGVVGAVTSCSEIAWACAAYRTSVSILGIDARNIVPEIIIRNLSEELASPLEWQQLETLNLSPDVAFTILLSAKECLFKGICTDAIQLPRYGEVMLSKVTPEKLTLVLSQRERNRGFEKVCREFDVQFAVRGNEVFTCIVISNSIDGSNGPFNHRQDRVR